MWIRTEKGGSVRTKLVYHLGCLLLISAGTAQAQEEIFLYEYRNNKMHVVERPLKPNRVHVRWDPKFSDWVLVLSDALGRLPKVGEGLSQGTILPGDRIGVGGDAKYLLDEGARWSPTNSKEVLRIAIANQPPLITTIRRVPSGRSNLKNNPKGYLKPKTKKAIKK